MEPTLPIALTVAGSDSGGGAGIQADLKTFQAFGVFGTTVVTAITAQNTLGVTAIHPVPLDTVVAQIDAVLADLRPDALKTGMLATAGLVRTVAAAIERDALGPYVLDPVMVATSGARLLDREAERVLIEALLPLATVATPNLTEASILAGMEVGTVEEMSEAARRIVSHGPAAALVKGGHLAGDAVDLLWDGRKERIWRHPRIETRHTHGTGCTLSAAITAELARGRGLEAAVDHAIGYVARAIASAPGLGRGRGPVNHFVPSEPPRPAQE